MKIEFVLNEKTFKKEDGTEIKYYVISRKLVDGTIIEIPVKSDKARLLNLSLHLENK